MNKCTKIFAMYLPQYHTIPENDKFWGKGFTDWVGVKKASPLFNGHLQPRVPLNKNYYDLSEITNVEWQVKLANKYGVDGFGIYHYWFNSEKCILTKPAEIILENPGLQIDFFFAWDNISWKRSWGKIKGNDWSPLMDQQQRSKQGSSILIKYELGDKNDWKKHFDYLVPYFKDSRYLKIENKPVFVIYHYSSLISEMADYWNSLAKDYGFAGICIVYKANKIYHIPSDEITFTYEPIYSGWNNKRTKIINKIKKILFNIDPKMGKYDYDKVWNNLLKNAEKNSEPNKWHGAFVDYDDTPRRGDKAKLMLGGSPEKFGMYLKRLVDICKKQNKEYIFLTAWNEWGEGAYLEPDEEFAYKYLEQVKKIKSYEGNSN